MFLLSVAVRANLITVDFESLREGDVLSDQLASVGLTFEGEPIVLTAGSLLNEFLFPPRSGSNVLADQTGLIRIHFATPVRSVEAFGTQRGGFLLRFDAFDIDGNQLSEFRGNSTEPIINGRSFFESSSANIARIDFRGGGFIQGDFVIDDLTFDTGATAVPIPEPSTYWALAASCSWLLLRRRFRVTLLTVAVAVSARADDIRRFNSALGLPELLFTGESKAVKIIAEVEHNANLIANGVNLLEVDLNGRLVRNLGPMFDDGTNGDDEAADLIYTRTLNLPQSIPAEFRYRASAPYRASPRTPNSLLRVQSEVILVRVTPPPFSETVEEARLVTENGETFARDEVLIQAATGVTDAAIRSLAASVGARIVGFVPSITLYQWRVPVSTTSQLRTLIANLAANPLVASAGINHKPNLTQAPFTNDLQELARQLPMAAEQYRRVGVIETHRQIADRNPRLIGVTVGVVDSPIDRSHPEFRGVNVVPVGRQSPADRHGTAVAGIIGANNQSATPAGYVSPAMNGIATGVPDLARPDGSKVRLTIVSGDVSSYAQVLASIDAVAGNGARVVNLSIGTTSAAGFPSGACAAALGAVQVGTFNQARQGYQQMFLKHPNVTFVVAAGNENVDAFSTTPANFGPLPNVITVGASNVNDLAAQFGFSVGGVPNCNSASNTGPAIAIAAPGQELHVPAIVSPANPTGYRFFQGTSAAAPMVSGTATLMLSVRGSLRPSRIKEILRLTADNIIDTTISGKRLNVLRAIRFLIEPIDVFFLVDDTASFEDDQGLFRASLRRITDRLRDEGINVYYGLGIFQDYPLRPFGFPFLLEDLGCQRAYERLHDISELRFVRPNITSLDETAFNFSALGRGDTPESQLPALFQLATGAGQSVTSPPDQCPASIQAGMQANFRPNSQRFVVLFTDAGFNQPGGEPAYPGPAFSTVVQALGDKGIRVIGLQGLLNGVANPAVNGALVSLALATQTLATRPVDCDGDGIHDLPGRAPLVCPISPLANGMTLGQTITDMLISAIR